jgi:hydrogenase-4 membrane subunit HyfE
MTNLYLLYVATLTVPLLFPFWRATVLCLGVQGLLLSLALSLEHEPGSAGFALELGTLLAVRAVFVPWYLLSQTRGPDAPESFSVINRSLWSRLVAGGLVALAFSFGSSVGGPTADQRMQLGTAAAAVLLGMLALTNQRQYVAQLAGLFVFEGGVTLVELLSPAPMPLPVQVGVTVIDVLFVVTCGSYLRRFAALRPRTDAEREVDQ